MPSPWILASPKAPALRLFCFPPAGGGAAFYLGWADGLAPRAEPIPIQPPGRENRLNEPPLHSVEALTRAIVPAIRAYLHRPYALFGHSMGSIVAFETAREIRRQGYPPPLCLLVSAKRPPHLPPDPDPISGLADEALIAELGRRFEVDTSGEMRPLLELMLGTIRTDLRAVETHQYQDEAPFDFPIVAFGGDRDPTASAADLAQWRYHTRAGFRSHRLAGGHFYLTAGRDQLVGLINGELTALGA